MRVFVGGVGYRDLCDHSAGVMITDSLATRAWPSTVLVEDISYNPIALSQRWQDLSHDERFELALVVSAVERPGRRAGSLAVYRWDNALPPSPDIQASIAEAVTGIISLDNTLVITRYLGGLPDCVVVVEIEPRLQACGTAVSVEVGAALGRAAVRVEHLVRHPREAWRMPPRALGGGQHMPRRLSGIEVKRVYLSR